MLSNELANALAGLPFPRKLFTLASSTEVVSIQWGQNGNTVRIDSIGIKDECFNPLVFNVKSNQHVLRQLSYYNFEKIDQKSRTWEFRHPFFKAGRCDLLPLVTRQTQKQNRNQDRSTGRRTRRRSKSIFDRVRADLMVMQRESYKKFNMEMCCQDFDINSAPQLENHLVQAKQSEGEQEITRAQNALNHMSLSDAQEDSLHISLTDTQADIVTSNLNEVSHLPENSQNSNLRFHNKRITRSQIRKRNSETFQVHAETSATPSNRLPAETYLTPNWNVRASTENSSPPKVCSTSDLMNGVLTTNSSSQFIVETMTGRILVENPSNKIYIKPNDKNAFIELNVENGSVYQYSGRKRVRDEVRRFSSADKLMFDCSVPKECFNMRNNFTEMEYRSNTCLPVKVAVLKNECNEYKEIDNYFVIKRVNNFPNYNDYSIYQNCMLRENNVVDCRLQQSEQDFVRNSEEITPINAAEKDSANCNFPDYCFPVSEESAFRNSLKTLNEMHADEFTSEDYSYLKSLTPDSFPKVELDALQSFCRNNLGNQKASGQNLQSTSSKWNPNFESIATDPVTQLSTDCNANQLNQDREISSALLDNQEKPDSVNLDHDYAVKYAQIVHSDESSCSQTIRYDSKENKEYLELGSRSLPLSKTYCVETGICNSQTYTSETKKFQQPAASSEASRDCVFNDISPNRMISNDTLKGSINLNSSENKCNIIPGSNERDYMDSQFPSCSTSEPYSALKDLGEIKLEDIFFIRDDNENVYQDNEVIMSQENSSSRLFPFPIRIKTEKQNF
ncbi:hypothetical protein AVEN_270468-1 [Araneus ventricosus]|uniref:HSF-type DNA-binding domain-containing protein n=1 Tax=Araneus ventricosus TaxID=182803 RepID=A0A4Y2B5V0_ARAVE|nr:hypothetical protein AVEN_270468-1 [Araneus ventricosus]